MKWSRSLAPGREILIQVSIPKMFPQYSDLESLQLRSEILLRSRIKDEEGRGWRKERLVNLAPGTVFFHFLFFPRMGFKIRDTTFHFGINGHLINKESGSY